MKIEQMQCTGNWMQIDDVNSIEYLLILCAEKNKISADGKLNNRITWHTDRHLTRDEVLAFLSDGAELSTGTDWYSKCRSEKKPVQAPARDYPEGRKLACGHTVYYSADVMSASLGICCADCYDRMSD